MSAAAPSLPTGLVPRFSLFVEEVKRVLGEGLGDRHDARWPLAILLGSYLSATLRRLGVLHARFTAGRLPAAPRARRPAAERAAAERPERRPPASPRGPVLLTVFRAAFDEQLRRLLDDPEMRALLAAAPQAGRLLRPLWRKLSPDPLPEALRLPPRPRRVRAKQPSCAPELRPVASPDGLPLWEPTPCFPPWGAPPRLNPAPAPVTRPAAPPPARPPDWASPGPPAQRTTALPRWLPLLFQR
ncbi:MAG TPA: hypothetical protein VLJ20_00155 [Acetobacteraceae bacterium]|nr:hypothetical protein [Acetobacteraceae bacterium]